MKIKKHVITILTLILAMTIALGMGVTVFAAEDTDGDAGDGQGYTYRVTIYAGKKGTFSEDKKVWKNDYHQGDSISISLEDLGFTLKDERYYVRGFRVTGHDNDETTGIQRLQIDNIDTDVAYELAYGIRGAMVAYTVNYVDKDGKALLDSETFYGMPGDKPVVSYRYVDGYYPNAYSMGKTLVEDENQNVFTFTYTKGEPPQTKTKTKIVKVTVPGETNDGGTGNDGGTAGATRNTGGAGAPGTTANPAGTAAPGNDGNDGTVDIDDNDTPLAGPEQYVDLDDNETPLAGGPSGSSGSKSLPVLIGCIAVVVVGVFLILIALWRRKRRQEENPEDAGATA